MPEFYFSYRIFFAESVIHDSGLLISFHVFQDLAPYLPAVVPGLKKSLLDPSPEVGNVSNVI